MLSIGRRGFDPQPEPYQRPCITWLQRVAPGFQSFPDQISSLLAIAAGPQHQCPRQLEPERELELRLVHDTHHRGGGIDVAGGLFIAPAQRGDRGALGHRVGQDDVVREPNFDDAAHQFVCLRPPAEAYQRLGPVLDQIAAVDVAGQPDLRRQRQPALRHLGRLGVASGCLECVR